MPDQTEQLQTSDRDQTADGPDRWQTFQTAVQTGARKTWSGLHDLIGLIPLISPLIAAGYYQADLARSEFGWAFPWYLLFPLSIEAGAAWAAGNYHRKLVVGDSTIGARVGMLGYATASAGLLYWHARSDGLPVAVAWAIAGMTFAAVWIWTQRAKHAKRDVLRARGLIDEQVPRFSAARWILCPIETPRVFRWAVKYSKSDPAVALDQYRKQQSGTDPKSDPDPDCGDDGSDPEQLDYDGLDLKLDFQTPDPGLRTAEEPDRDPEPDQTADSRPQTPDRPTGPQTARSKPADRDLLQEIQTAYPDCHTRPPTLKEIRLAIGCGQSKAIRLRSLLQEEAA